MPDFDEPPDFPDPVFPMILVTSFPLIYSLFAVSAYMISSKSWGEGMRRGRRHLRAQIATVQGVLQIDWHRLRPEDTLGARIRAAIYPPPIPAPG